MNRLHLTVPLRENSVRQFPYLHMLIFSAFFCTFMCVKTTVSTGDIGHICFPTHQLLMPKYTLHSTQFPSNLTEQKKMFLQPL